MESQERKCKGLGARCSGKPKAGLLRCEACLARARVYSKRVYDKAHQAKREGGSVEPQCNVSGKLRADHVFDEDGLCDCGARKMEFAPRPALRPEILKKVPIPWKPKLKAPTVPPPAPAPPPRSAPKPPPKPREKDKPAAPGPEKRISNTSFAALVAELEEHQAQLVECIAAIRRVEEWWPRS